MSLPDPQKIYDTLADLQALNVFSQAVFQNYSKFVLISDHTSSEYSELRKYLFENMPKLESAVDRLQGHLLEPDVG